MNNEEKQNINGIPSLAFITPENATNQNSEITNKAIEPTSIIPVQPIQPTTEENSPQVESQLQEQSNPNTQNNMNIIIPQMKDSNDNSNPTNNSESKIPELKLNSTNPFDIGINQMPVTMTNEEKIIDPTNINNNSISPNNNPINSQLEIITPINDNQSQDINLTPTNTNNENIVPVSQYLINIILFSIPIIGLIMLIMKIKNSENKNISNLAKAYLIVLIAGILLWIIFAGIFDMALFT